MGNIIIQKKNHIDIPGLVCAEIYRPLVLFHNEPVSWFLVILIIKLKVL